MQLLTSKKNHLVKLLALLKKSNKFGQKNGLVLLEGEKVIKEAYKASVLIKSLFIREGLNLNDFFFCLIKEGVEAFALSPALERWLSTLTTPPGVMAIGCWKPKETIPAEVLYGKWIMLVTVQDAGNVGNIIRISACLGIDGIIVTQDCVYPGNYKVIRASMGNLFHLPVYRVRNPAEIIKGFKKANFSVFSTSPKEGKDLPFIKFPQNLLIIFGNESQGLPEQIINLADRKVRIPIKTQCNSLNISVAAGIILYEIIRQSLL